MRSLLACCADFDAQRSSQGARIIGNPDEVVKKIVRHSKALRGISRIRFQQNAASLPHLKMIQAIKLLGLLGTRVAPALPKELGGDN
jgi:hypothetical protein